MKRYVEGEDRSQAILFPERLDDYIAEDNPVRVIDVFVAELDLAELGFEGMEPEAAGRPAYTPATLLKIYVYVYLRLSQPYPVEPTAGAGSAAQCRAGVVDRSADAGLQDDCGFPQGQWGRDPPSLRRVHGAVPADEALYRVGGGDRRE